MITYTEFQTVIWQYYHEHGRVLPWRETRDPYKVMVSELMLQQTQVIRVIEKYQAFMIELPTLQDLAKAPTSQILRLWQGLGYNRRALNLQRAAQMIVREFGGVVPESLRDLQKLPGIGPYTAGAIAAFAYNRPVPFIETNIRRVFIHYFFDTQEGVDDKELWPIIEATLDLENPREWYYALMDYGAQLPKQVTNPNRRSAHYTIQSQFVGSNRQLRGKVLAFLVAHGEVTASRVTESLLLEFEKVSQCLQQLTQEGFLEQDGDSYQITK